MYSYSIGQIYGIPIKIHITLLIFLPIIALQISAVMGVGSLMWGFLAAFGLFASVGLHELGHSVVALSKRIRVREILLLPIGGLAQLERMPENPDDEMQIALAGPIVSFGLAIVFWLLAMLLSWGPAWLILLLRVIAAMNLMLALFNLLPSFPMDGGRIFRAWLTPRLGLLEATRIAARTGRGMAIAFGIWGLLRGSLITIAVAVFIYMAAGAEYRMVQFRERMRGGFSFDPFQQPAVAPDEEDDNITVSPPPYERAQEPQWRDWLKRSNQKVRKVFDDLFDDWNRRSP